MRLGSDPFDPHDISWWGRRISAMLNRFGPEGFLVACNPGPRRYEEHLAMAGHYPEKRKFYIARLASLEFGCRELDPSTLNARSDGSKDQPSSRIW
jgi:hypothetical protein